MTIMAAITSVGHFGIAKRFICNYYLFGFQEGNIHIRFSEISLCINFKLLIYRTYDFDPLVEIISSLLGEESIYRGLHSLKILEALTKLFKRDKLFQYASNF